MTIVDTLCKSEEPAIRYKVRRGVLGEDPDSRGMKSLAQEVKHAVVARTLPASRDRGGRIQPAAHPYAKWYGGHRVFAALAECEGSSAASPSLS